MLSRIDTKVICNHLVLPRCIEQLISWLIQVHNPSTCLIAILRYRQPLIIFVISIFLYGKNVQSSEWSVKNQFSQHFEIDDNITLSSNNYDIVYGFISTLNTSISRSRPEEKLEFNGNIEFQEYQDLETEDILDGSNSRLAFDWSRYRPNREFNLLGSFSARQSSNSDLLQESGIVSDDTQLDFFLSSSYDYTLNSRNKFIFTSSGKKVEFLEDTSGKSPYLNLTATAEWNYKVNSYSQIDFLLNNEYFMPENTTNSAQILHGAMALYETGITRRLKGEAGLGIDIAKSDTAEFLDFSNASVAFPIKFGFDYDYYRGNISFALEQKFSPSSDNIELSERGIADLSILYKINNSSTADFAATYQRDANFFEPSTRDFFSLSSTYNRTLSPNWSSRVGHTYRRNITYGAIEEMSAHSNKVYLVFTRIFDLKRAPRK